MLSSLRSWRAVLMTAAIAVVFGTTAFAFLPPPDSGARVVPIVNLSYPQLPESIAFDRDGNMYLSLFTANQILKIDPEGNQTTVEDNLPQSPTGIRLNSSGDIYFATVDYANDFSAPGIVWRIHNGRLSQVAEVPGFPNGLAFGKSGNLYVSDSFNGDIYRINGGVGPATVWASSDLLAGTSGNGPCGKPHPFGPVGANGLAFGADGDLFVTNTSKGTVVQIQVEPDGHPGEISVFAGPACSLWGADGLAPDILGNLYVAANAKEDVVRVDPRGHLDVIASAPRDPLSNPSDVAFGTTFHTRREIFIANFAIFNGGVGAGVVKENVGVEGKLLP